MMMWMLRRKMMKLRRMMLRRKTDPKSHFVQKFTGEMPDASPAASVFCEPAQSKCTWTCHNRHLSRN